jgi:hypothetical protein
VLADCPKFLDVLAREEPTIPFPLGASGYLPILILQRSGSRLIELLHISARLKSTAAGCTSASALWRKQQPLFPFHQKWK